MRIYFAGHIDTSITKEKNEKELAENNMSKNELKRRMKTDMQEKLTECWCSEYGNEKVNITSLNFQYLENLEKKGDN